MSVPGRQRVLGPHLGEGKYSSGDDSETIDKVLSGNALIFTTTQEIVNA